MFPSQSSIYPPHILSVWCITIVSEIHTTVYIQNGLCYYKNRNRKFLLLIKITSFISSTMFKVLAATLHACKESKEWSLQLFFQFKKLERSEAWKIRASMGLKPVTSVTLYQLSYEATHCERGQFYWVHISRQGWNDMKYIWNNSYLNCGCRWKWRMVIAVNFPWLTFPLYFGAGISV